MKVIIIEDEKPAAEKLLKGLQHVDPGIEVVCTLNSIASSVAWLKKNPEPELIFMDIELTDGLSFKIFDLAQIGCPVIFCTAYDEYWQEAFEHNSIDYLLKPVKQEKLELALGKYEKIKKYFAHNFQQLQNEKNQEPGSFKKRWLVKKGMEYASLKTETIAYFYAMHKVVCLIDDKNQKFILDHSLNEIEKQLDPSQFYRVNRKFLVNMNAIKKIKTYPKSKLQLDLEPALAEEIIISQENVADFKAWMGR